jgi:CopG family transcriptional regulator/antitoxin EndoAI
MGNQTKISKRINIVLPSETIRLIEKLVEKGKRSHFINEAIRFYIRKISKATLRKQLKEGAIKRAERDLILAEEWFFLENEVWQKRK